MQAMCSCHTRLCRRHRRTGSSNRKARSTLQSCWALVLTPTWMQMSPRATVPSYRVGGSVGRAALRLETGRAAGRSRTAQDANAPRYLLDAHGSRERAGPVGRGELPGRLGGAGRGDPKSRALGWAGPLRREGTPGTCPGRPGARAGIRGAPHLAGSPLASYCEKVGDL
jgi:hypothetical protein